MPWVTLEQLKGELGKTGSPSPDDASLQRCLDAAVAYVEDVRPDLDYVTPAVPADVLLGTLRLAKRYWERRIVTAGSVSFTGSQGGTAGLPYRDPDIERLLGIGYFQAGWFV